MPTAVLGAAATMVMGKPKLFLLLNSLQCSWRDRDGSNIELNTESW